GGSNLREYAEIFSNFAGNQTLKILAEKCEVNLAVSFSENTKRTLSDIKDDFDSYYREYPNETRPKNLDYLISNFHQDVLAMVEAIETTVEEIVQAELDYRSNEEHIRFEFEDIGMLFDYSGSAIHSERNSV